MSKNVWDSSHLPSELESLFSVLRIDYTVMSSVIDNVDINEQWAVAYI